MQNEFSLTLSRMMKQAKKTPQEVADLGGLDPAYVRRLLSGEKCHPTPLTIARLWLGIVFDPQLAKEHPVMVQGLAELSEAASWTAASLMVTGD